MITNKDLCEFKRGFLNGFCSLRSAVINPIPNTEKIKWLWQHNFDSMWTIPIIITGDKKVFEIVLFEIFFKLLTFLKSSCEKNLLTMVLFEVLSHWLLYLLRKEKNHQKKIITKKSWYDSNLIILFNNIIIMRWQTCMIIKMLNLIGVTDKSVICNLSLNPFKIHKILSSKF